MKTKGWEGSQFVEYLPLKQNPWVSPALRNWLLWHLPIIQNQAARGRRIQEFRSSKSSLATHADSLGNMRP